MSTAIFVQGHVFGILLAIAKRLQAYLSFKRVDNHFGELQEVRQERCVQYTYIDHNIEEVNELRLICVITQRPPSALFVELSRTRAYPQLRIRALSQQ